MLTIKKSLISLISVMLTISMSDIAVINANASENELTQDELQSLIYAGKAIPESSKYYYLIGADAYTNTAAVRIDKTNASKMIKAINNYSSPAYIPDEASPNYVFPDNPLNEVKFTQVAPYKMTAKIALDSDSNCTGAFIGPKIMLTAAHCVSEVHTDSNGKVTRRTLPVDRIIPAQQCSSYTNDETESKKMRSLWF